MAKKKRKRKPGKKRKAEPDKKQQQADTKGKRPYDPDSQTFEVISFDRIIVPEFQREQKSYHFKRLKKNFVPALCPPLMVTNLGNGFYSCTDGRHRMDCLTEDGFFEWLCMVLAERPIAEEANIFRTVDSCMQKVEPLDDFKAALVAKDKDDLKINEIVTKAGFSIAKASGGSTAPDEIRAIRDVRIIYRDFGEKCLKKVLEVIGTVWPNTEEFAVKKQGFMLRAFATFVSHPWWKKAKRARLIEVLRRIEPIDLKAAHPQGKNRPFRIANGIAKLYNDHLKQENKLPTVETARVKKE